MEQQTRFKARKGDIVLFFRKSLPQSSTDPAPAIVVNVGLNQRLDLHIFNKVLEAQGGRPTTNVIGAIPGDLKPTPQQLTMNGTWLPKDVFHEWDDHNRRTGERPGKDNKPETYVLPAVTIDAFLAEKDQLLAVQQAIDLPPSDPPKVPKTKLT